MTSEPGHRLPPLVTKLSEMAAEAESSSRKARMESRAWIYASSILSVLTAVMAFAAGFSGLNQWVGPDGVVALSFGAGLLGVLAVFINKAAETRGQPERMRSEALRNLKSQIDEVIADYETYTEQLTLGERQPGYENRTKIITWLQREHHALLAKRRTLRKFAFARAELPIQQGVTATNNQSSDSTSDEPHASPPSSGL